MPRIRRRAGRRTRAIETALATLGTLALAVPALAGDQGGNLESIGTLVLELGPDVSQGSRAGQFRLDDGDPQTTDRYQVIFDQKVIRNNLSCLLGLAPSVQFPPDHPDTKAFQGDAELVSLAGSVPVAGIDVGKFAIGGRDGKGTGCGQLSGGEIGRLDVGSLLLAGPMQLQVEAKQNAAMQLSFLLRRRLPDADCADLGVSPPCFEETPVGTPRYLVTGNAAQNPPPEVAAACGCAAGDTACVAACVCQPTTANPGLCDSSTVTGILDRADGGPDSGNQDDGIWRIGNSPAHNAEVYRILQNSDGSAGAVSLKGGGEYPAPTLAVRSTWTAFEADGVLACGDPFFNDDGTVTGSRTNAGECASPIPYDLEFDGEEVVFNVRDTSNQGTAFAFKVRFDQEAAPGGFPISPTILSYAATGVSCSDPPPVPEDGPPFSEACIPLDLCVGTPIRQCADGNACVIDTDCAVGGCQLVDLLPPALGFPDQVEGNQTLEYGCVCEENVVYLGPVCADGSSCDPQGAACADESACEDKIRVDQCLFFTGDAFLSRKGR